MLQFLRKIIGSKFGVFGALALLVLIALAFAGSDVAGMRSQSGGSAGDSVATVGGTSIGAASLSQATNVALQNVKQDQPTMSMQAFLASGGLTKVLDSMVDRTAMLVWGKRHGVVASDRLVDSEIAKLPAFQGPDGKFSQTIFRQTMQQRGVDEKLVRQDLAEGLVAQQLLVPASFGATMPRTLVTQYAALLKERREGAIAVLPSELFAPQQAPDAKALATWYQSHRSKFIRPERRTIRYAVLDAGALKSVAAPTEPEIAARYKANASLYQPRESRRVTQLIVPSEAEAKSVIADVAGGKSLETAAQAKGLATSTLASATREALANQTSPAVADAAFGAARGAIAAPARDALGWHVVRIDTVEQQPGRTLDQARKEIAGALSAEAARKALADASGRIEDEFDSGGSLADAAKAYGLEIKQAGPLTADGQVYGSGTAPPAELAHVLATAFSMEQDHQPQIAEVDPGKQFVLFNVSQIAPSAPAPLAEIKQDVAAAYALDQGSAVAGDAAKKVLAAVKRGSGLAEAVASLKRPLPPPQNIAMNRDDLAKMQQQTRRPVPPPLALMFSMAQGTTKLLPVPGERGWFVVSLKQITPGTLADDDPLIASARKDLGDVAGDEYAAALRRAIRDDVGVARHTAVLDGVRRQLSGGAATDQ